MPETKCSRIHQLPILVLRSILHSKSLDEFCKRLSIIIADEEIDCSIRRLGHLETIEIMGSVSSIEKHKAPDYPSTMRTRLIRTLINGSPTLFFKKNQIWDEAELGKDFIIEGQGILVIPVANEIEDLTWLEFRQNNSENQFRIHADVVDFLQIALAVKMGSDFGVANSVSSFESHNNLDTSKLTSRQKSIVTMIGEGFSNNQIATQLRVSPSLIKLEVSRIFKVLNVSKRSELFSLIRTY